MCTPIGHVLAGTAIYRAGSVKGIHSYWFFFFILLCANLPDVDFLFGFVEGNPNLYHHMWTHSLTFCAGVGVLTVLGSRLFHGLQPVRIGLIAFGSVLSHLVLDYFTVDQNPPFGIKLFWPFTENYYISSVPVFQDVYRNSENSGFFKSLICRHNGAALLIEIAIMGSLLVLVFIFIRKRIVV
jgi:inner membrane protein